MEKPNFKCNVCGGELSKLVYRLQKNNTLHLVGLCDNCGYRYLPFVRGLDIPIVESKLRSNRKKRLMGQEPLL